MPRVAVDGPVLAFGGPYSNLEATRAMLDVAQRLGVPPQRIECTGDVVAYCADPLATLELVRSAGILVVQGNCEESLSGKAADCGCGFAPGSACDRLSRDWYSYADQLIPDAVRQWMAGLPPRIDILLGGYRLAVVHADLGSNNRFVFASSPAELKLDACKAAGVDGVIAGHCGLPFTQIVDGRLWHNPGVIGLPANDGTPRSWYSVISPQGDHLRIAHRALDYDHRMAADRMRRIGLPEGYAEALETGLWPSRDVLPDAEWHQSGVPLEERSHGWPPVPSSAADTPHAAIP